MFGLGIYIYAGEDLPEVETTNAPVIIKTEAPTVRVYPTKKTDEEKSWLNKSNPKWSEIVQEFKNGTKTIANLRNEYKVSKAIEAELTAVIA